MGQASLEQSVRSKPCLDIHCMLFKFVHKTHRSTYALRDTKAWSNLLTFALGREGRCKKSCHGNLHGQTQWKLQVLAKSSISKLSLILAGPWREDPTGTSRTPLCLLHQPIVSQLNSGHALPTSSVTHEKASSNQYAPRPYLHLSDWIRELRPKLMTPSWFISMSEKRTELMDRSSFSSQLGVGIWVLKPFRSGKN